MSVRALIGVLGGTFDPVHLGHLVAAREIRRSFGLDRMLMMLSARPPHKSPADLTPVAHREAMLRIAVADLEGVLVSRREVERDGTGYTIDTLRELRADDSPLDPLFVIGWDSLHELPTWHDWRSLAAEFDLIVVERPDALASSDVSRLHPELRRRVLPLAPGTNPNRVVPDLGRGGRILLSSVAPPAISSSMVRARVAAGDDVSDLVPAEVARYIRNTGLYRVEDVS